MTYYDGGFDAFHNGLWHLSVLLLCVAPLLLIPFAGYASGALIMFCLITWTTARILRPLEHSQRTTLLLLGWFIAICWLAA